jgi:hypothetical protein
VSVGGDGSLGAAGSDGRAVAAPVVDLPAVAARLVRTLRVLAVLVVATWAIAVLRRRGAALDVLAAATGVALLLAFVAEVVVVGGAAVRGMLAAGSRGDRLSAPDVGLVPPQLGCLWRRLTGRHAPGACPAPRHRPAAR